MHPDETKAGNAIGVPLNETAVGILRKQQGLHKRWVFVHTTPGYRSDGTKTAAVRKMRTDSNKAACPSMPEVMEAEIANACPP